MPDTRATTEPGGFLDWPVIQSEVVPAQRLSSEKLDAYGHGHGSYCSRGAEQPGLAVNLERYDGVGVLIGRE